MGITEQLGLEIVTEGFSKFMNQMQQADGAVGTTASAWEKGGGVIGKVAGTAFTAVAVGAAASAAAVVAVGGTLAKLAIDAAPLQGIGAAFETLAAKGIVSLDAMRTAANGTVSDFELMRMANVALTGAGEQFGAEFGENLPKLLATARAAAKATGQDVGFLFQSLVTGIKRSSPLLIDNTGLVLKVSEANEAMAKSLGKSVEDLTAEEKQIALLNATVAAGDVMVAQYGSSTVSASEQLAQFKTQIQNTKDKIGMAFLPVLQQVLTPILALAEKALPSVIAGFESFADILSAFGNYIGAVLEDGDLLNDWLTNLPQWMQPVALAIGEIVKALDIFKFGIDSNLPFLNSLKLALDVVFGKETSDMVMGVVTTIIDGFNAMVTFVTPIIQQFSETFTAVWNTIQTAVASVIPVVIEYIKLMLPAFQEFGDFVRGAVQAVVDFALPLFASMVAFFGEQIGVLVAWARTNLPLFQSYFETGLNAIKAIWDVVWPAMQLLITSVWTVIETLISVGMTTITSVITTFMQIIQGDWSAAWETIQTAAATIWDTIQNGFSAFLAGVLSALGTSTAEFQAVWSNNWEMFNTIVSTVWTMITSAITGFLSGILTALGTSTAELQAVWSSNWEAFKTILSTAWTTIKTIITTAVENIKAAFDIDWGAVGSAIIDGIASGISAGAGAILDAARAAAQSALDAARNFLGGGNSNNSAPPAGTGGGGYQHGGTTHGRSFLAGEHGPELITGVPGGARVMSAPATARAMSQTSITNNYNLTTNSQTRPGGLALEFATMEMGSR